MERPRLAVDNTAGIGEPEPVPGDWLRKRYAELETLPDTAENRRRRFELLLAMRLDRDEWRQEAASETELSVSVEGNNTKRLRSILEATGWECRAEVPLTGRGGEKFRADLLVCHPEIAGLVGAIEVKDAVGPAGRDYVDAVKQASDYVGSLDREGRRVEWAAVYPVVSAWRWLGGGNGATHGEHWATRSHVDFMSGVFELASKHLKVHAMFHEPRSYMPRGDRLVLIYLNRHVIWCEENGFRGGTNGAANLCGKRQVGGRRL